MSETREPWNGATQQYLTAARALWDLFADTAAVGDPAAKARAFGDGLSKLQQEMQSTWLANLNGGPLGFMPSNFMPAAFMSPSHAGKAPVAGLGLWADAFQQGLASFEWPALGLTRERQEAMQRLNKLLQDYWQAQTRLSMQWAEVVRHAFVNLNERVRAKVTAGEVVSSPKALYDLWIESAEAAFAQMAHGQEYARIQGDLTNALSSLRTEQRKLFESFSRELDLPTRDELNSVHRRVKELKSELRALESALSRHAATTRGGPEAAGNRERTPRQTPKKRASRARSNGK